MAASPTGTSTSTIEPASVQADGPVRAAPPRVGGFALVTVIIVLGAIAYLVLATTAAVRTTLRHATTSEAALKASLAADGGIELGIEALLAAAARDQLRHIAAKRVECSTPDGSRLRVDISDDAGRIDLNIARPELITALLRGLGLEAEEAARVADNIADYRDSDDQRRPTGAEAAEYRAAGRAGPANAAFGSIDELAGVLAVTPDLFRRMLPFVTVGSRLAGIDPRHASPDLVELLASGGERARGARQEARFGEAATGGLARDFVAVSVHRSYTIRARAQVREGATQVREASVEVVSARRPQRAPSVGRRRTRAEPDAAVLITRWSHGSLTAVDGMAGPVAGADLPRC